MKNKEVEEKFQMVENGLREHIKDTKFKMPKYKIVAIGYLDSSEPFEKGEVSNRFLNKLREVWDTGLVLMSMGFHECDFCEGGYGTNERAKSSSEKMLVDEKNKIKYVFPEMIFHYIKKHNFQPKQEFIEFVMNKK